MAILEIKKRNGIIAPFDASKITAAMSKAFAASGENLPVDSLIDMTKDIVRTLEERFPEQVPSVEHVQDFVELALMKGGYLEVAKHYIACQYLERITCELL